MVHNWVEASVKAEASSFLTTNGVNNYLCLMKKEISKFLSLNWYDIFKGAIMFFLSAASDVAMQMYSYWMANAYYEIDWNQMLKVAGIATVAYLLKQIATGRKSEPEPIKPEITDKIKS
jgi:hypothetical protein